MILGLMMISPMNAISPAARPVTAPAVLKRRQKMDSTITGRFARRRNGESQADQESHVDRLQLDREEDGDCSHDKRGDSRDQHLFPGLTLDAAVNDIRPEIVRERGRRADRQARHHAKSWASSGALTSFNPGKLQLVICC